MNKHLYANTFLVIKDIFQEHVKQQPDMSLAVVAISVLTQVIKDSKATTMMELNDELKSTVNALRV